MDQRLNFITLAVADTAASRRFYTDGLGWTPEIEVPGEVVFFTLAPTVVLSLWNADHFETEAGKLNREPGTAPLTLAHNVPRAELVDEVMAEPWPPAPPWSPRSRTGTGADARAISQTRTATGGRWPTTRARSASS